MTKISDKSVSTESVQNMYVQQTSIEAMKAKYYCKCHQYTAEKYH